MQKPKRIVAMALAGLIFTCLVSFAAEPQGKGVRPVASPTEATRQPELTTSQIVKKYSPSVVTIVALDQNGQPLSLGSGFFINAEGDVASNHHVLEGSSKAIIKTMDGRTGEVLEIINDDPELDLLIAKTSLKSTNPLPLGDSDTITVGEEVIAIGNPAGLEGTVSNGIVSGVRKVEGFKFIQITAPISPGSSGGPVFNSTGNVIGIATAYLDIGQNLNFAMPSNYLKSLKPVRIKLSSLPKSMPRKGKYVFDDEPNFIEENRLNRNLNGLEITTFDIDRYSRPKRKGNWYERGNAFLAAIKYEDAIAAYLKIKQVPKYAVPDHLKRLAEKGNALLAISKCQDAIEAYSKAIELDPKFASAYLKRGFVYYMRGYEGWAFDDFDKVIEFDPEYADGYFWRGMIREELGNYQEAIRDFDRAIDLEPKYIWSYSMRGHAYVELEDYKQAIRDFDRVIELYSQANYVTFRTRGLVYYKLGKYGQAIRDFDRAINLTGKAAELYHWRGLAYDKLGNHKRAIEDYDRAKELNAARDSAKDH